MCLSICLSVTSRCSAETAKCELMQTVPRDSPGTLVFWCWKSRQLNVALAHEVGLRLPNVTPNRGAKCRWGRSNAGVVAADWQLSTWSIVNWVRKFITLSVHLICLQYVLRDAAHCACLSSLFICCIPLLFFCQIKVAAIAPSLNTFWTWCDQYLWCNSRILTEEFYGNIKLNC